MPSQPPCPSTAPDPLSSHTLEPAETRPAFEDFQKVASLEAVQPCCDVLLTSEAVATASTMLADNAVSPASAATVSPESFSGQDDTMALAATVDPFATGEDPVFSDILATSSKAFADDEAATRKQADTAIPDEVLLNNEMPLDASTMAEAVEVASTAEYGKTESLVEALQPRQDTLVADEPHAAT